MKIKISKSQWKNIGRKAGWIKIANSEVIQMDGKWYNENLEEVPDPNLSSENKKSITINIFGYNYTFKEGEIYKDAAGDYIVDQIIDDKKMKVTYRDGRFQGEQRIYNITERAKIIHNEEVRQAEKDRMRHIIKLDKPSQFFTLGFLANQGRIWVEIPKRLVVEFETLYKRLTGEDPRQYLRVNNKVGGYAILEESDEFKRPMQLRIAFNPPDAEVLNKMDFGKNVNWIMDAGRLETSNSDYLIYLFKNGFTIGNNIKNIDKIRANVPPEMMSEFNDGFNFTP